MNSELAALQPYPFEKLANLKAGLSPSGEHIALSIGEPKHPAPEFVLEELVRQLPLIEKYPGTKGSDELRQTIATWLEQRFALQQVNADTQVLPVNGTREAIFAFVQAAFDRHKQGNKVVCPNPFYQIYEGAALLAGGEPHFIPCLNGQQPDFDAVSDSVWQQTQILFICTPNNPTGATLSIAQLQKLIHLADKHDFILASDECYSEIYLDEAHPPIGLLEACAQMGRHDYRRCVVFHSLSKRSNLPGLRSGFIAGDASIMADFLRYRTYHGCAMPLHHQMASIAAWQDETHVASNRDLYRVKFKRFKEVLNGSLDLVIPPASFYYWAKTPIDDEQFAKLLYQEANLTVLPGRYLGRTINGINPGEGYIRMAMVATVDECLEAGERIKTVIKEKL